jgi:hypothetical protein
MIFGKTTHEQLWRYRKHKWFAWYPCTLENGCYVWLQWIWRQKYAGWVDYYKRTLINSI